MLIRKQKLSSRTRYIYSAKKCFKPSIYQTSSHTITEVKSSILSSTSFQMGKTFWEMVSAAGRENGNLPLRLTPGSLQNKKVSRNKTN